LAEALSTATLKDKSRYTQATQHSAKKMAKRLFEGLNKERDVLIPSDFEPYFATKADAEVAFALFDKDGNGDISKKEMRSAVQRIYRERKALKASLKDMGSAVSKLDGVMLAVCLIIILL
jgi:Ca2+-binding EF-hand superfamily protein